MTRIALIFCIAVICVATTSPYANSADDRLVFEPDGGVTEDTPHVVLVSGDEEYRSEESMPMMGKLLAKRHGCKCTVLFALSKDGSHIDINNSAGIRGFEELDSADLMLIATRFRTPDAESAKHITEFLKSGKPVIGVRTSTHAFNGKGAFGSLAYKDFGLKILGETWVSHHGRHKTQGCRGVVVDGKANHPVLNGVGEIFVTSDVYGVIHLTDEDEILMRAAVTESLDPASPNIEGDKNDPMQPFVWLREYKVEDGKPGRSLCTTSGAAVDLLDPDLRRLVVNAVYFLTDRDVPSRANVDFVDAYTPSFFGFIREKGYWESHDVQPSDFGLGKSVQMPDPKGTPEWNAKALAN